MNDKTPEELKAERVERLRKGREDAKARRADAGGGAEPVPVKEPDAPQPEPEDEPVGDPQPASAASLSDDERERIRAEARKAVEEELRNVNKVAKKDLMRKALDDEILEQRRLAGLTDYRDDIIDFLVDVAPFTDRIVIDGTTYFHGYWYKVPRKLYEVLRETCARSWDAEDRAGNPNKKFHRTVAGTMNPMLNENRMADGTLTMARPTSVNAFTGAISGAGAL